jgi:hypothetical protein
VNIEWMILGEGIAQDADGDLTIVGLNQNVFAPPALPAHTKRAVIIALVGETWETDAELSVRFTVLEPDGAVIMAQSTQTRLGPSRHPQLPWSLLIPAEFIIQAAGTGRYEIRARVSVAGHVLEASKAVYVLEPQPNGARVETGP